MILIILSIIRLVFPARFLTFSFLQQLPGLVVYLCSLLLRFFRLKRLQLRVVVITDPQESNHITK
ncbi:hypothetical protein Hanom_Chr03g00183851 [Helianthus anomalus]